MTTVRATAHRETKFGPTEWLRVIHECNEVRPEMFGQPETCAVTDDGYVEEYPDARVIIDIDPATGTTAPDSAATIESKTDEGAAALAQAARNLGIVSA